MIRITPFGKGFMWAFVLMTAIATLVYVIGSWVMYG